MSHLDRNGPNAPRNRASEFRYHRIMKMTKLPGFSLLLVGAVLFFLVRPFIDAVPLIGGALQGMAFVIGALGLIGGAYLILRSVTGFGR